LIIIFFRIYNLINFWIIIFRKNVTIFFFIWLIFKKWKYIFIQHILNFWRFFSFSIYTFIIIVKSWIIINWSSSWKFSIYFFIILIFIFTLIICSKIILISNLTLLKSFFNCINLFIFYILIHNIQNFFIF